MRFSRWAVWLAMVLMAGVSVASADTLHGYCVSPASTCSDNGTITPTGANPPYFAFDYAGNKKNGHGDFWLIDLVPDNQNSGFSLTLHGANTTNSSVSGSLSSPTEWKGGFLGAYLTTPFNFGKHPAHPFDAYLPSTQTVDSGANGYFVYLFDFGNVVYNGKGTNDPSFSVSSGAVPQGSVFLAVLTNSDERVTVDTPNSASILEDAPAPHLGSPVPEPSSILLLGSCTVGLAGVLRRKLS